MKKVLNITLNINLSSSGPSFTCRHSRTTSPWTQNPTFNFTGTLSACL
uniref:Uncharacterized protein n=1 Tax=Arundo donax TaxID=35708 RepID=A0A0A9A2G1_ARUDO